MFTLWAHPRELDAPCYQSLVHTIHDVTLGEYKHFPTCMGRCLHYKAAMQFVNEGQVYVHRMNDRHLTKINKYLVKFTYNHWEENGTFMIYLKNI